MPPSQFEKAIKVSTHSRPKAAGLLRPNTQGLKAGFNTQPPEGGWKTRRHFLFLCQVSTHSRPKAAGPEPNQQDDQQPVSTHSRPKAAGIGDLELDVAVLEFQHTAARRRLAFFRLVRSSSNCFNTQPPEGGWNHAGGERRGNACFNTQPPEGGWSCCTSRDNRHFGFNTQPPEGGWETAEEFIRLSAGFQHTAARRRLGEDIRQAAMHEAVSTHSRPKAAGDNQVEEIHAKRMFQHTAARRRLACPNKG